MIKTFNKSLISNMKNQNAITLVSLVITIALMLIIASTVSYTSFERFELNKLHKMINDIELLNDKVQNYYLKCKGIPVVRDETTNEPISYTYTTLDFEKNENDNENYYIVDLQAIENVSLNYGKEGFENINNSDDVYIINESSHKIYYVRGINSKGEIYHSLKNNNDNLSDNIPPTKPEIKVISGTKNDDEIYTTQVKIEIVPGKDSWSGIEKTTYSINNGEETDINTLQNNIYTIISNGIYEIKARSYDNAGNVSDYETISLHLNIMPSNDIE